jgi:hypothetical protein
MRIYSAVLGFFIPSDGGKWIIETPHVMQANDLRVHLGWAVHVHKAAEALPNLINTLWMLSLLGVLGLEARDVVGFTFLRLLYTSARMFLLSLLAPTLPYHPPVRNSLPQRPNGWCGWGRQLLAPKRPASGTDQCLFVAHQLTYARTCAKGRV